MPHWDKITLVGVGLLGGSLGLAVRERRLASRVVGYVRRQASVLECEQAGAVDKADTDLWRAVEHADLVVLCTPLAQMAEITTKMLPALQPGCTENNRAGFSDAVSRSVRPASSFAAPGSRQTRQRHP